MPSRRTKVPQLQGASATSTGGRPKRIRAATVHSQSRRVCETDANHEYGPEQLWSLAAVAGDSASKTSLTDLSQSCFNNRWCPAVPPATSRVDALCSSSAQFGR